jgi:protein-tyrosine-phosphatase
MNTVIFACIHNAGRSQMAAAWFNALADSARARAVSAGTDPGSSSGQSSRRSPDMLGGSRLTVGAAESIDTEQAEHPGESKKARRARAA